MFSIRLFASRYSLPFLIAPAIEAIFKIAKKWRENVVKPEAFSLLTKAITFAII
jgi:hypothetical protein